MSPRVLRYTAIGIGFLVLVTVGYCYIYGAILAGSVIIGILFYPRLGSRAWMPAVLGVLLAVLAVFGMYQAQNVKQELLSLKAFVHGQKVQTAQPVSKANVNAILSSAPLESIPPVDRAGRVGLLAGMILGVLGIAAYRPQTQHGPDRVHGLKVAQASQKGTSRWAGDADVAKVAEFGPPKEGKGGTIVGSLRGRMVRLKPDKSKPPLPQHTAVIAGTGAGKSYSFVIPNVISAAMEGESIVVTDPKGELACLLGRWLQSRGYHVYMWNLAYPEHSMCWNPILECRDDEEITAFATAIVQNAARDTSGYFVMKEIQLLKALIYLLRADFPAEQAHLRSALSLLSWSKEALNDRFETAYREGRLARTGYEEWKGAISGNYENAVSGLTAKLGVVRAESIAKLLSRQEIDLTTIGREKAALFCVLPIGSAHLKPVLASFYYFFFRRLYGLATECGGKLPNSTRFLLDEFANIGQVPGFVEIISTARSLGIKIQFVLQGLKQLQDVYGGPDAENIMANCPIQLFLGGDDATTTRYFSSRLGEAAVYAESERKDVTLPWNRVELPKRTETIVRRALMEPEELSRMDPMAAVCVVRWCLPMYLEKTDWTKLPQSKEITGMAVSRMADICPSRPDVRIEIPDIPEGEDPVPARRRDPRDDDAGGGIEAFLTPVQESDQAPDWL